MSFSGDFGTFIVHDQAEANKVTSPTLSTIQELPVTDGEVDSFSKTSVSDLDQYYYAIFHSVLRDVPYFFKYNICKYNICIP